MIGDDVLQLICASVSKTAPRAAVILFGSYARGDNREDSDIDLLILLDQDHISRDDATKITYPLYDIETDVSIIISPLVMTRKEWESGGRKSAFYYNVMGEGRYLMGNATEVI